MNNKLIGILIASLFVIASFFIYKKLNPKKLPSYLVEAVGKIDGNLINLNTKYSGRILKLNVDTGDEIKQNEIVAVLDSKELKAKLNAITYSIKAKQNELNFTTNKIDNNIKKANLDINIQQNNINQLSPQIATLHKIIHQDKKDENRIAKLVKQKLAQHHELEMAILKTKTNTDKLKTLLAKKEALLNLVKIAKYNQKIALSSKENIKALQNEIEALKANKHQIQIMINDLTIKSPINGYVDTKIANIGEVLADGMPIISIIDPQSFYLKLYIDEINNGKIKIGQKAEIFLDSSDTPIIAKVTKIAKKAEFTPKDVAVRSDRITRVYEVHLKPLKPNKYLKLGLPSVGVILIGNGKLPTNINQIPKM